MSPQQLVLAAAGVAPRLGHLVLAALTFLAAALYVPDRFAALVLVAVAGTLAALAAGLRALAAGRRRAEAALDAAAAAVAQHDPAPCLATGPDGEITWTNAAAGERFGAVQGGTLARALGDLFANPAAVVFRLQNRAAATGAAQEEVVTRRGHVRLAAHRLGPRGCFWRFEELTDRSSGGGRGADSLGLPMLTASRTGTILYMNEALRNLLGGRVKTLDRIFTRLPLRSGEEVEVAAAAGPVRALAGEIEGPAGRREIYLLPVAEGEPSPSPSPLLAATPAEVGIEGLPVPVVRVQPDGRTLAANRLARDLLGLAPEAALPVLPELVDGLGRPLCDWLAEAAAGRGSVRPEVLRVSRRDDEVFVQVALRPVAEAGRTVLVAVLTDATALKTLEAQFVQSQKMQAIGQLAGGIAHDFNNLLTAIAGHCDLLLLRHDPSDQDYADLSQIQQNANRAASLVGQLLAFSRKQTLSPEILDLRDLLADLIHLLGRLVGQRVTLTLGADPELPAIRADRRQFEQVLMNLVVNARDAMPAGGEIRIETETLHLAEELRRDSAVVAPGDYVVVRVCDAGEGIPPERLAKIFEPFFTTKRPGEGTGLGLSMAYGIVKQSGGFIFVDSTVGVGTTFSLMFPAHHGPPLAAPAAVARAAPEPPPPAPEAAILLVEDEAPVRAFAARALRLRGYRVIEAENAEAALEVLADPGVAVDLVVTDVVMPGMDGPSWVREALRERPALRVVFVSGYAEEALSDAHTRIPNAVFLPKPFSLGELTATVQRQLH
ncbi:MAG: response regulator [Rhodobacteraceae bacterium]|nr:response regulator [Paracoccaceae bacterium]